MIIDINKQRVDSDIVELFELEINATGTKVYFTTYPEAFNFYALDGDYTIIQYAPLPISFSGYEQKSEGAYSRPTISFANVLSTFKNAIGASNDALVGRKITRRKTLYKYRATEALGTEFSVHGQTPIEQAKQVFLIDRVEREDALSITFELTIGFDLQGINVPNRYILANTCTWLYQGADPGKEERIGACKWKQDNSNQGFTLYYDSNDRPIISGMVPDMPVTGITIVADNVYKESVAVTKVSDNTGDTTYTYWQALLGFTKTGTFESANFRRCRLLEGAWSSGIVYETYLESKLYNPIVSHDSKLWLALYPSENIAPGSNSLYWERADICGKKLSSCARRFKATEHTQSGVSGIPSYRIENNSVVLPYGGFPGAKRFNR